ncbi:hypothetical protein GGTG_11369 [Gaeumannomyces tritici R3-111a-1]|uniref:Signal peptidase complex subunit 2 n=1 Tax=Gaeumannomyces tritici (strain R3-111a-1) TaxID=644352 RepID=J3PCZ6_GAET3|nr:hypothetical protein GGTG_11369 [Gaeumannomyces tritici R3-111a-1]EJT70341.1 hypothetical protein GGTG_11369 [Gaeumannomyces tritici R3-111a-1]
MAEKITVYNLADLKNTSDDAIPNYLNSLKFKQSHALTDVRLGLGYGAFLVAAACFLWDYKLGFEGTKYYTAAAVALYTLLNGALTVWIWGVERGIVYVGTAPSGEKLTISSTTLKNDPTYRLTISVLPKGSAAAQSLTVAKGFNEWFDSAGHFIAAPFQTMLATAVPAIGRLDSKRLQAATPSSIPSDSQKYDAEVLDALLVASTSGATTGAESGITKKGGSRRKA